MRLLLKFNFKRSMKKLIKDYVERASRLHVKKVKFYFIKIKIESIAVIFKVIKEGYNYKGRSY